MDREPGRLMYILPLNLWHNVPGDSMATAFRPGQVVQEWLGAKAETDQDLVRLVERGVSLRSLQTLLDRGLTKDEVFSLIINPRTLKHRRSKRQPLSREESERAVRAARVLGRAEAVFTNHEKALRWMRTPKRRLEGRSPMQMLVTEPGARLVEEMLVQIDEGLIV